MASRAPAPGDLELVREFVNTFELDGDNRYERLATPEALVCWLEERGLLAGSVRIGKRDLDRAVELREALRGMLQANNGLRVGSKPFETFDRLASSAALSVRVGSDDRAHLQPTGSGFEAAIGRIAAIVYQSGVEGTWPRLKACRADDCHWAFYDASRNRSGTWCDMADCGNRAKVRAYRERAAARTSKKKR
jgi:predicted RNA-binding Zn ribbon-like protein